MSGKEQFIKLPREVLESEAFGSLGINGFRVLRFLMIEHMRRGGRQNGNLKAPHRHLVAFGIAPRHVTAAVGEAEQSGLVGCHRRGLRIATTYELTWLPLHDGNPASEVWQQYQSPENLPTESEAGPENLPTESEAGLPTEGKADRPKLPTEGKAEPSGNLPTEGKALYRSSYQGGDISKEEEGKGTEVRTDPVGAVIGEEPAASAGVPPGKPDHGDGDKPELDPSRRCGRYVTNSVGFRICGKPALAGTDHCAEHARPPLPEQPALGKHNGRAAP
jgi:hypothetical protein